VQLADAELAEFHGNHAAVLDNLGRGSAAATQRRLAIAAAVRAGDAAQQVSQLANQAVSQHAGGHLADMLDTLAQAERLIAGWEMSGSTVGFVAVLRCQAERCRGRFAAALAAADLAEQQLAASNPARLPVVQLQRGHVWLDLGQTARAQQALNAAARALPPHLEARRCLLLARAHHGPEAAAWRARLLVRMDATRGFDAAAALTELAALDREAEAFSLAAVRRALLAQRFERWCEFGREAHLEPAPGLLRLALAQLAEALPGDGSAAALAYLLELPWQAARLLAAAGLAAEAAALRQRLRAWVNQAAENDVPAPFREAFVQRQPVNRALLADGWPG
jgi:hypothetical protein